MAQGHPMNFMHPWGLEIRSRHSQSQTSNHWIWRLVCFVVICYGCSALQEGLGRKQKLNRNIKINVHLGHTEKQNQQSFCPTHILCFRLCTACKVRTTESTHSHQFFKLKKGGYLKETLTYSSSHEF